MINIVNLTKYIGKLDETSLKHRTYILMLSAIMMFVDPNVVITFSSGSLAGLGISITPPQSINISYLIAFLLVYRLIAFWISTILNNATNSENAKRRAISDYDPSRLAEDKPRDSDELISSETRRSLYYWSKRQVFWEFTLPNCVAIVAILSFSVKLLDSMECIAFGF